MRRQCDREIELDFLRHSLFYQAIFGKENFAVFQGVASNVIRFIDKIIGQH